MTTRLFISDLHLSEDRPKQLELFFAFLQKSAVNADELYILGDLFEVWVGDDSLDLRFNQQIVMALAWLSRRNVRIYFMPGNRDFLVGEKFAEAAKLTIKSDPWLCDFDGEKYLLAHGDTFCSKDITYQGVRRTVRSEQWQKDFLSKSLKERLELANRFREQSEQSKSGKSDAVMDAVPETVELHLRAAGYPNLIHGHTHNPARHVHDFNGHKCTRWVLPDWYEVGGYLIMQPGLTKMRRVEFQGDELNSPTVMR
jgi:UDP-2,3-diacylglucosamine hydrolase